MNPEGTIRIETDCRFCKVVASAICPDPPNPRSPALAPRPLMVNGRHDYFFPVESSQEPMFRLLGTDQKEHVLFDSGHAPSERGEVNRRLLAWLDRYLGPVSPR